ncbi:hypothetical protein BX600DRAFT_503971 [Xylariales sp. PMI_506]|nr:hypothetical protein BX600DRAFT_503971 [Xylariales sp. PMI_506]
MSKSTRCRSIIKLRHRHPGSAQSNQNGAGTCSNDPSRSPSVVCAAGRLFVFTLANTSTIGPDSPAPPKSLSPRTHSASIYSYHSNDVHGSYSKPNQLHIEISHPGILEGADFCSSEVQDAPADPPEGQEKDGLCLLADVRLLYYSRFAKLFHLRSKD